MPADSADTKRRLLDAAFAEFAHYGLAGARVDRIAAQAKANKRLIYAYFGNKEQLFDTVTVNSLDSLANAVPFAADDLPGYAAALFDHMLAHPEVVRLTMWKLLERPEVSEGERAAYLPKVHQIQAAQNAGGLDATAAPVDVLMMTIGLVGSWFTGSPSLHALAGDRPLAQRVAQHRVALVDAVRRMCTPTVGDYASHRTPTA